MSSALSIDQPMNNMHAAMRLSRAHARRLARWMLAALALAFVAMIARVGEITHDAFHEMALFRVWVESGVFPRSDLFAYTPTVQPSVHHEWGTGAVLYLATMGTGLGLTGLTVLKFALISDLWFMLYRVARMRGVHPYLFAIFAVTVFPTLWVGFATIRATLFTLVLLSVQLWMQELDRRGHRLWLVAWWGMLIVWLNLHAGFVVGIGLLGLHAADRFATRAWQSKSLVAAWRSTWHLALAGPMIVLALPINPYGWQYVPYLAKAISMPRPLIIEWQPLWHTHDPVLTLAMFGLSVAWIIMAARKQPLGNLVGLLGLAVCAVLALKHLRHGSIYSVVWIAYAPAWITHTSFGRDLVARIKAHPIVALRAAQALAAAALVWAVSHGGWRTTLSGDPSCQSACYPTGAVAYLEQHDFRGNLLTPFHAGAYVSWEMYPHVKVSLDGRYEVAYAPPVFDEHWEFFHAGASWSRLLDQYPHDAVLVHQSAQVRPLLESFRGSPDDESNRQRALPTRGSWRLVYEDDAYILLARADSPLRYEDHRGRGAVDRSSRAFALATFSPRSLATPAVKTSSEPLRAR